jgi:hypothetical protein
MGFDIVKNNRKQLDKELDSAIDRALTMVGLEATSDVMDLTPVKSGRLKGSIDYKVSPDEYAVYIGTDVKYAPYVELGTSKQKATNGGKGFLRLGIQLNYGYYKQIFEGEIGEVMNKSIK